MARRCMQLGKAAGIGNAGEHVETMNRDAVSRKVGLARALSKLGFCSRSQAAKLIRAGRVRLNGVKRIDPECPVQLVRDRIEVDGTRIAAEARTYLMLNKPRGIITTASDEKSRDTVYSLLDEKLPWVGPVGRLDKASEGLLLLTNDTEWAARIGDPNSHVDKTYHVQVTIADGERIAEKMIAGVVADGELLRAKSVRVLRRGDRNTWLEIVLDRGKNRQIRRMAEVLGAEVKRLVRVAIGPILLGDLAKGRSRALTAQEKKLLDVTVKVQGSEPKAQSLRNGR